MNYLFKTFSPLIAASNSTHDGIWTGHDWVNSTVGIGVNNGVPYGLTATTA